MRQLVAAAGSPRLIEVAAPEPHEHGYLVRAEYSLISPGTELGLIEQSARSETPVPLGYSLVGEVVGIGADAPPELLGSRVACAGYQYAHHAEFVAVPRLLAAPIPTAVDAREATFTTLGALAIHALRIGEVALGHQVLVLGLGVVGQLLVRVVRAAGARVAVFDPLRTRVALALAGGAELALEEGGLVQQVLDWTSGAGTDAVFLCTAGGQGVVETACACARDRGLLVTLGTPRLEIPREPFFQKELQLRIARAYGPGRYDPRYEDEAVDYPIGYVRWTEQRNMAEFLRLVSIGDVRPTTLCTREFDFSRAAEAYRFLRDEPDTTAGVILRYQRTGATRAPTGTTPANALEAIS